MSQDNKFQSEQVRNEDLFNKFERDEKQPESSGKIVKYKQHNLENIEGQSNSINKLEELASILLTGVKTHLEHIQAKDEKTRNFQSKWKLVECEEEIKTLRTANLKLISTIENESRINAIEAQRRGLSDFIWNIVGHSAFFLILLGGGWGAYKGAAFVYAWFFTKDSASKVISRQKNQPPAPVQEKTESNSNSTQKKAKRKYSHKNKEGK